MEGNDESKDDGRHAELQYTTRERKDYKRLVKKETLCVFTKTTETTFCDKLPQTNKLITPKTPKLMQIEMART
jgi:hypothetical protein